jgi:UPF0271 protein
VPVALERFGDSALRARLPAHANRAFILDALHRLPGVLDVVVAERHALVTFDPARPPQEVGAVIEASLASHAPAASRGAHRIGVRYDGPDLDEVAARAGLSRAEAVELHAGAAYQVVAIGFLPGFAYARGLDPRLVVPRRSSPRARIQPLSVGIAGPYTGVYPFASPGGWNVIGTAVDFAPFDPRVGARLAVGDTVCFFQVAL